MVVLMSRSTFSPSFSSRLSAPRVSCSALVSEGDEHVACLDCGALWLDVPGGVGACVLDFPGADDCAEIVHGDPADFGCYFDEWHAGGSDCFGAALAGCGCVLCCG